MPRRRAPGSSSLSPTSLPRRFQIVLALAFSLVLFIILSVAVSGRTPSVPSVAEIKETAQHAAHIIQRPNIPQLWNPLGPKVHEPLEQANSTQGDTRWYSDLNWLNPFSWLVTLDADRTLLPPLQDRTPIYTFYKPADPKDDDLIAAENALILQWRRAWWAQGFKPIVLGHPEATKHENYAKLHELELEERVMTDAERWLAWAHMGGGLMSNWLVFPMAANDEPSLAKLRSRDYQKLRRFKGINEALMGGKKADIEEAIKLALSGELLKRSKNVLDALPSKLWETESSHSGIAYYSSDAIAAKYKHVVEDLAESPAKGLQTLSRLINAHLQLTWQGIFSDGISILAPHADHAMSLTDSLVKIASRLGQCPESPVPNSCPPNKANCRACVHLPIAVSEQYSNKSSSFTIGAFQHPFTYNTFRYMKEDLDARFIRRNTSRDQWLTELTGNLLGSQLSGPQRLLTFKEAVAGSYSHWRSLWLTGEREEAEPLDLGFLVGFEISPVTKETERMRALQISQGRENPSDSDIEQERTLLQHSREYISAKNGAAFKIAQMVQAWNMADTEAWQFVKAYGARRIVERLKWEEDEKRYAGTDKITGWLGKVLPGE